MTTIVVIPYKYDNYISTKVWNISVWNYAKMSALARDMRKMRERKKLCRGLLNIWEFVYFVWRLSPPKRCVVRWRYFTRRCVPTMCKTSAGWNVFPTFRVIRINTQCVQILLQCVLPCPLWSSGPPPATFWSPHYGQTPWQTLNKWQRFGDERR